MTPKYSFGDVLICSNGMSGRVVEITLLRRDESTAYGLRDKAGRVFYALESEVARRKK